MRIAVTAERQEDWDAAVVDLLHRVKQAQPDQLAADFKAAVAPLGIDITLYLVDLEQDRLWAMPAQGSGTPPPIPIDGTRAGQAFASVATVREEAYRLWVPMVDGSERLGVGEVVAGRPPADEDAFQRRCEIILDLMGHLVATKMPYGDALHRVRRTRPMAACGELIMAMLPPLTFSHPRMAVSAILEPCYDVGGDAFDYAVDGTGARFLVLDAMGRGLNAALTSSAAMAAIRASRRDDGGLHEMCRAADAAILGSFRDVRFATGVLGDLDLATGRLRYVNAGHPQPVLFRDGKAVGQLSDGRRMPLGLDDETVAVGEETLQPGDRLLLFTDGVTDAFDTSGDRFGIDRLVALTEDCLRTGLPPAETLRRLTVEVRRQQGGQPTDDATLLMVEWSAEAAARSLPRAG